MVKSVQNIHSQQMLHLQKVHKLHLMMEASKWVSDIQNIVHDSKEAYMLIIIL